MGALLPNFLELNEILILTFSLTFAYLETGAYIFTTLMPSISESYSQHMMRLTRRYLDQGLRWGLIVASMLGGAFLAFSDVFVKGLLPPQFARAAAVMILMHLWRVTDFSTRLPDQVFQGVGRTGTLHVDLAARARQPHNSRLVSHQMVRLQRCLLRLHDFVDPARRDRMAADGLPRRVAVAQRVADANQPRTLSGRKLLRPARIRAAIMSRAPATSAARFASGAAEPLGSLPIYMFFSGLFGWDAPASPNSATPRNWSRPPSARSPAWRIAWLNSAQA